MESESGFEGLNTVEERARCARGASVAKGQALANPCGGRVPHGPTSPLVPCGTRASHGPGLRWPSLIGRNPASLSFLLNSSISLHLFSRRKSLKSRLECSLQFSQLPNTITFSYEVRIEWFKLEIVRDRVLYLFQVILQLFDWFSEWSTQKTEPAREIKVEFMSWWFHLFKPSICLGFLLLYVCVCMVNAIEKDSFTINLIEKSN